MDDLKDLHIHIERGPYTAEWIEKFVDSAIKMNIHEINLLEHSIRIREFHPYFKEAREYNSYQKKWVDEKSKTAHSFDEYKELVTEIRKREYPIKINFGLEICWFEQYEKEIKDLVSDGFFDYILGSVHWVDNWTFNQRKYQWLGKDVNKIYERYFAMENSLVESEIFDIIAHPDLITCHSLYPSYDLSDTYKSLCENIKSHNMMLEMNSTRGKKLGVNEKFFEIAKSVGVDFSTGSDAHSPEDVGKGIAEMTSLIYHK